MVVGIRQRDEDRLFNYSRADHAEGHFLKVLTYLGGAVGLATALWLLSDSGLTQVAERLGSTGLQLLWLLPLHALVLLPDVAGWRLLLAPCDRGNQAPMAYLFWVATLREAINRLLPVANVGGEIIGIRLVAARGISGSAVAASVIVEVLLTLFAQYFFVAIGISILISNSEHNKALDAWIIGLTLSLVIPLLLTVVLRYIPIVKLTNQLSSRLLGPDHRVTAVLRDSVNLDDQILDLLHRPGRLFASTVLQLAGMLLGAFEVSFILWQLGHSVTLSQAIMIESLIQAARQVVFIIPGGLGVQELGLIALGQVSGFDAATAVTLSMAKRLREVIFGMLPLLSWQWAEWRRKG